MKDEIPENTVLSHDLLEGNFLRCGLLTDVMLLDGYPLRYIPYILRNHRWTRGDWQIIKWLKSRRLNTISKFKIYDNLRRSILNISSFIGILLGIFDVFKNKNISFFVFLTSVLSIIIPFLIDIFNYVIFKESNVQGAVYAHKKFSKDLNGLQISFLRIILQIIFLPYETLKNLDSILKSLYRMKNKTKMLEWMTAEDGDKNTKTDLNSYYISMQSNVYFAVILIFFGRIYAKLLGFFWLIGPIIAWYISLEKTKIKRVDEKDIVYLRDIAKKTWNFFEKNIKEENHYLMIDNYQENRNPIVVDRTSSTNIGLELLAIISAYDLGFINLKEAIEYINKIIETVSMLSKWNGHLYNWYNIKNLNPLLPRYVSSVDSGNFIGYLYIVKQFLIENKDKCDIENLLNNIISIIENTDFSYLYSSKEKLLSVGFNLDENKLTNSYYDFLASEARQASLVAIAKGDIPVKHWNNLSRTLTCLKGYKGLISWTGTAFEYLMPNINFKRYSGSLIDESCKFAILSQIEYCKKIGIPWGISESAYNLKDLNGNYQYKAFGIPWLGLKRGLEDDFVISPYSTFLALQDVFKKGVENIKLLEKNGALGKFGFYESIDYTPSRLNNNKNGEIVKTYMAHHQGLILLSINNVLNNDILKNRFNNNPEIEAVDILLQERMPIKMILTKEKKEKVVKNKGLNDTGYIERVIEKPSKLLKNINVLSNKKYKVIIDDFGEGYSEYNGKIINNYKETSELKQGIFFYLRNINSKKIIDSKKNTKVTFAPDKVKFSKIENNLKVDEIIALDSSNSIEIRRLEIENFCNSEEVLEIISELEPVLSDKMQEYFHPAFNKLFLKIENNKDNLIVERKDRKLENSLYMAVSLYTENEQILDFEFEIDKEKYYGRENYGIPCMIKNKKPFSNLVSQVLNPIIAMKRTIKIAPKDSVSINLIIAVSENKQEAIELLENTKSEEEIIRILNVARARSEEESKYLQITSEKMELYSKLLNYILVLNSNKKNKYLKRYSKNSFWKFGISGDLPIILIKIRSIEDIFVIEEIVCAFEYYKVKNIDVDLVILNEESNVYERYVKEGINEVIANKQLDFFKNENSGIFVLNKNEISKDDIEAIEFKARIIIDASYGSLSNYINEMSNISNIYKKNSIDKERNEEKSEIYPIKKQELLFFNEFGGFSKDGKEYYIIKNKEKKLPSVWCNILSNKFFGTIVTDNLGGFTWDKNSKLNRLTAWNNNNVNDLPSEIFFIKDEEKNQYWTLNSSVFSNDNFYYITHGFGYSTLKNTNYGLIQNLDIFVPNEERLKIYKFNFKNTLNEKRKIKILMYIKSVLGEDEFLTNGNIFVQKKENVLFVKNSLSDDCFNENIMYVSSNLEISSFTGEKNDFFGEGDLENPDSIYRSLNNFSGSGKNSCIGIEFFIDLEKFENKNFNIILGEENSELNILNIINKYKDNLNIENELLKTKNKWNNILNVLNIKTPEESLNIIMNGWVLYQTISSRLLARSAYYQSGGAFGFRDQLQDAIGIRYVDSSYLKSQILECARHQFIEGDVLHWWHSETKRGIRTKFSDDLLWLVYAVIQYINFENSKDILYEQIEYLKGELLKENEDEKYNIFYGSGIKDSLFEHCVKAIEHCIKKGIDPFPKIGSGDWNDGFSNVGTKGKGESVWLAFFLYKILNDFIPICEEMNRKDLVDKYSEINDKLKKNVNTIGWDGRWFKRAITDDGIEIGSINSDECRIDSISQSWAVISGAGDNDKKFIAMNEVENYLVDRDNKLIKLFTPAYEKSKINPGYIKAYPPGIRENGGQYTHAAIWVIIAEAILGFGDKAVEFLQMINPIEHSKTKDNAKKFKIEPYVIPADVYSQKDLAGIGGWNWYTGSSCWYFTAVVEYILGLKISKGYLKIEPCISKEWKEYEIEYKYKTSIYKIKVKNIDGKNTGIKSFFMNGEEIKEKKVLLQDNGKINNIEVYM